MALQHLRSKNSSLIGLTIFMSLISLYGCGSSDSNDGNSNNEKQRPVTLSDLAGTYEMTEFTLTKTEDGSMWDQNSAKTWSGRMVITSQGLMHVEWFVNENDSSFETNIIEVENDAVQIKDGGCVRWIDFIREEDSLTLIFPEDKCAKGVASTLGFHLTSKSEYIPTDADTATDVDLTLSDLVGEYELTGFSISDTNNGGTADESNAASWSGKAEISADGYLNFTHILNEVERHYRWEILVVENNALLLRVQFSSGPCEEWVDMQYQGDTLDLIWRNGDCWQGFALTLHLQRLDAPDQGDTDTDTGTGNNTGTDTNTETGTNTNTDTATNPIIAELAGDYVQTGFTVIYTESGQEVDESDAVPGSWYGYLVITEQGNFNYRQITNGNENYNTWMILDAESDALQLNDGICTQWAEMQYDQTHLTVRINPGECMTDTLILRFERINDENNLQSLFHFVGISGNRVSGTWNDLSRRTGEIALDRQ